MTTQTERANPERLAYWYFRLNGFLTTENFIVHPDDGTEQRTDADLLAVRFAHRAENLRKTMKDDPRIAACNAFSNVIIAEIKTGPCRLNGPWTDPTAENMRRVVKAIGCVPDSAIDQACAEVYERGRWCDDNAAVRLFALGDARISGLTALPEAQQITWSEVIRFCVERFERYRREKASVGQWAADGLELKRLSCGDDAEKKIRHHFGLRPMPLSGRAQDD